MISMLRKQAERSRSLAANVHTGYALAAGFLPSVEGNPYDFLPPPLTPPHKGEGDPVCARFGSNFDFSDLIEGSR